jgi:cytochrome c-type biogenesis protein CcmH/NrfG
MGFIDTDEFLVPKTTLNLKELLKEYEAYGGLAVSSLFFGSNGHQTRPIAGQIVSYTRRTNATFKEFIFIKSIVQPRLTLMPNSPHDFIYKENTWCVDEGLLRVDYQQFPSHTEKIQLNHYYCRSEQEIDLKLQRGRGDEASAWPRTRSDDINRMATEHDTSILQNLEVLFQQDGINFDSQATNSSKVGLLEKMATLVRARKAAPLDMTPPHEVHSFRVEFYSMDALRDQTQAAIDRKEYEEVKRLILSQLQRVPQNIVLYLDLSVYLIYLGDPAGAWQALQQAWQLSPNNYVVLGGMAFFFLKVEDFNMAENTCRLLLELAPHELGSLGMLTHSLIGQGRFEEALQVGVPVIELSAVFGALPERMGSSLVKKMADYLLEKKDFSGAVRLWQAGVKCQPGDINVLLELSQALLFAGDNTGAHQCLTQARKLDPQNVALQRADIRAQRTKQVNAFHRPPSTVHRRLKRGH